MPTTLPARRAPPPPDPAPLSLAAKMALLCIAALTAIVVFDQLRVSFAGDGASSVQESAAAQIGFPP